MPSYNLIRLLTLTLAALGVTGGATWGQGGPPPAGYQFAYEWANASGVAFADNATVRPDPGTSLTLQLYLKQTANPSGGTATFLNSEGGLFGGGVRATYGGAGAGSNAGVVVAAASGTTANANGVTINPAFNDTGTNTVAATSNFAQMLGATSNSTGLGSGNGTVGSGNGSGVLPGTDGRVLLGTFTFQVIGNGTQSTILTAERARDLNTNANLTTNVSFRNLFTLDGLVTSQNLIIAPVPEPTGILAVSGVTLLAGWVVRRRRGRPAPTAA